MFWQTYAHAAGFLLVAGLAWTLGGRGRPHRLVAALFATFAFLNVARMLLDPVIAATVPPYSPCPAYYLDHLLCLAFRFALLGVCARHFANVRWRFSAGALGATWLALIAYKELSGQNLLPFHFAVAVVTIPLCWVLIARTVLAPAHRFVQPDAAHAVLVLLAATDLVKVALEYGGPVTQTWPMVRNMDLVVDALIVVGYSLSWARRQARRWQISQS